MKQPLNDFMTKLMMLKGGWYWLGNFGRIGTEAIWNEKSHQKGLESWYIQHADAKPKGMGKRVTDCNGVAKFCHWVLPDGSVPYDASTDLNESQLFEKAKADGCKWGSISTIPREREGLVVTYTGHMGIYLGNGTVLESRGGNYGVVITNLDGRGWTSWYENPFVDYSNQDGGEKMLYKGCPNGEPVKEWQESLLKCGYKMISDSGKECTADGEFGGASVRGTNLFKKDFGLTQDGIVDDITYGKMLNKLRGLVITTDVTPLNQKISELNTKMDSLTQQNALLTRNYDDLKTAKVIVDGNLVNKSTEYTVLSSANAKMLQEIANLDAKYKQIYSDYAILQEDFSKSNANIVELQSQISIITQNMEDCKSLYEEKIVEIGKIQKTNQSLTSEVERLKTGFVNMTIADAFGILFTNFLKSFGKK